MNISVSNYLHQLSRAAIKAAEKLVVRECDEESKGLFIAYVDEGKNSYDVTLTLNAAGEVTASGCDCAGTEGFCGHKLALLLAVAGGVKKKKAVIKKAKLSKAETLLSEVSLPQLKEWISGLLRTNKDLELQFIHQFESREQQYNPEDVKRITHDSVKAVVKAKRNIDQTQVKKILELWKVVHAPVLKIYYNAPYDPEAFNLFAAVLDCCMQEYFALNVQSKKIREYLEAVARAAQPHIALLEVEDSWAAAINQYLLNLNDHSGGVNMLYLEQLYEIMTESTGPRQKKLADIFIPMYFDKKRPYHSVNKAMAGRILTFVTGAGLTDAYLAVLRPLNWQYDYNQELIRLLMEKNKEDIAEKYCLEQIKANTKAEYDLEYLLYLKEIYARLGPTESLVDVLGQLLPFNYDFEDYLFIQRHMSNDEEKKSMRTSILSRARNASRNRFLPATEFIFRLMDEEKNYKKMLGYANSDTPYKFLHQYFTPLALTGKMDFIRVLIDKQEPWDSGDVESENGEPFFPDMYRWLQKHYPPQIIDAMLAEAARSYRKPNGFMQYIMDVKKKK